jgi:uncharacterized protein YvpB
MEPGRRHPARMTAVLLALPLSLATCSPAGGGTASPARTSLPSQAELSALANQVIPHHPQYDFYVECINFKENGVAPPTGNDYSTCPLTPELRAHMEETQAHFCPCDQNVSRDRTVKGQATPDGAAVVTISLYFDRVKVELHAVRAGGRLLVDQVAGKGDLELGPVTFQSRPSPTPTAAPPTVRPVESFPPTPPPSNRVLAVPWYHQVYELSCEEASLRMGLAYEGIATTDDAVYRIVGDDPRPPTFDSTGMHWGGPYETFVGNINGSEVALTGYGTYYPPIARAATQLGGKVLRAGEAIPPGDVYQAILDGHPVVAWVTYHWVFPGRKDYVAFDGRTIPYAGPVEHAVTVIGVSPSQVLINNPWSGPEWIDRGTFEAAFAIYNRMAVILN